MNRIIIETPIIRGNRIDYRYAVEGEWKEAFYLEEPFFVEYSCDISMVPDGIAIIPLLCNILPMAWIYDAEIVLPVCDADFYRSIPDFKQGYIDMYPMLMLGGRIKAGVLQTNNPKEAKGVAAFFSGGVDSFSTLICHRDEKPLLLTVWGADVSFEDVEGWERVKAHLEETSRLFGVDHVVIKSCIKRFSDRRVLSEKVRDSGDNWWHGFQHSIGLIGHAAPVMYSYRKKTLYMASTHTAQDLGKVTCASIPAIDNNVRFCGMNVVHDGFEFTRQNKIHNITNFSNSKGIQVPIRVCWESKGGTNCCACEKCWRTILGIYAEGCQPKDFGFIYDEKQLSLLSQKMRSYSYDNILKTWYTPIQAAMKKNIQRKELPSVMRWFYDMDIDRLGELPVWRKAAGKLWSAGKKVKRKIRSYIK